jgi:microcystin-dependent protein
MANANSSEGAAAVAGTTGGTTDDLKSRFQAGSIPLDTDFSELIDIAECGRRAIGQSADQTDNSVGAGMQVAPDSDAANKGKLSLKTGLGLGIDSADHSVRATVHTGYGMDVDANGLKVKIGNGVEFDSNGNVAVKAGSGIMVDSNGVSLNASIAFVKGMIMMFSGSTVPDGWHICDGSTVTGSDGNSVTVPDLRNRFILGADTGTSGRANGTVTWDASNHAYFTATSTSANANVSVQGHALSVNEMPKHSHRVSVNGYNLTENGSAYTDGSDSHVPASFNPDQWTTVDFETVGGGASHSHGITDNGHTHAANVYVPYFSLAYIMKI